MPLNDTLRAAAALGKHQDAQLAVAAAPVAGGVRSLSMSLAIGTRVLDLVSGEKGTVIDGKRESVIIPLA